MGDPKLHHYVPQFYLRRFTDQDGRLWVWDRIRDRVFATAPRSIAAESNFYFLSEFAKHGHDPMAMEKQFSDLEGEVSIITGQWLDWIRLGKPGDPLIVPEINRELVSLFLALQFMRTADARSIATSLSSSEGFELKSEDEKRALHLDILWNDELISSFTEHVSNCTWIFGHNQTSTPFMTSDNPVAFRTADNRMWLKGGMLGSDAYVVYPLAPDVVMYCYPDAGYWKDANIRWLDCRISPVAFVDEMVSSENSAQAFMASRFVISNTGQFEQEREFAKTIGTDLYRDEWLSRERSETDEEDPR